MRLTLDQIGQSPSLPDPECLQGWGIHSFSGPPAPAPLHPHDQGQLPQPALVCRGPQLLTISKAWAGPVPHTSVSFLGCGDQEGSEESIGTHRNPKKEREKEFLLLFFWFIDLGFLKFISQHWKELLMKQLEGTSTWRPALLPGRTAIYCFSKETAAYILALVC